MRRLAKNAGGKMFEYKLFKRGAAIGESNTTIYQGRGAAFGKNFAYAEEGKN